MKYQKYTKLLGHVKSFILRSDLRDFSDRNIGAHNRNLGIVVTQIYNLTEYSKDYSKTAGSAWYC